MRCSIVMPALNEGEQITKVLVHMKEFVAIEFECLVVVDDVCDSTVSHVLEFSKSDERFKVVINEGKSGPASAIKAGIRAARSSTIVVTMADNSDDFRDIDKLVYLIERGIHIACASRYMPTGQQIGAPIFKSFLSRNAGKSLYFFAKVDTRDATNSFKAYSREFLDAGDIEASHGFEMGVEMIAKARRKGFLIAEIPTIWIDRKAGQSNFKIMKWLPSYLRWYFYAFGIGRER